MQIRENLQIKSEPPRHLAADHDWHFPPLTITLKKREPHLSNGPELSNGHAMLHMEYEGEAFTFSAEYKANWQERAFQAVLEKVKTYPGNEGFPLVILPYLSEPHLDTLAAQRVSGLDLCGNGLILVPGHWLIRQSGKPNRFQIEQALRNPYQGKASLVGRTLLQKGTFVKLDELHDEIVKRGGDISLSLVSRTIQRLDEDVITLKKEESGSRNQKTRSRVRLVQPEKLLDALVKAYEPRRVRLVWRGKIPQPENALPLLFTHSAQRGRRAVVTGIGSATRYASLAMESTMRLYLDPESGIESFLSELEAAKTERFANLEIYAYPDATCFFEGERDNDGVVWASPLQTYMEMMQNSDIRLRESATTLRKRIFGEALSSS